MMKNICLALLVIMVATSFAACGRSEGEIQQRQDIYISQRFQAVEAGDLLWMRDDSICLVGHRDGDLFVLMCGPCRVSERRAYLPPIAKEVKQISKFSEDSVLYGYRAVDFARQYQKKCPE